MRKLKISLQPKTGSFEHFYAYVNDCKKISGNGKVKSEWEDEVDDSKVKIKIEVDGVNNDEFELEVLIDEKKNAISSKYNLKGGYYENTFTV